MIDTEQKKINDRLQFEAQLLRDRIAILEALILPKPEMQVSCERVILTTAPAVQPKPKQNVPQPTIPELNIGAGMTTGARG
jgi:hypothetical protein